jgi:secreted trypsin-like serine protease
MKLDKRWNWIALAAALCAPGCVLDDAGEELATTEAPIIGGQIAPVDKWAFTVALTNVTWAAFPFGCGATQVAPRWIMTAAHCIDGVTRTDLRIIAGRDDLSTAEGVVANVTQMIPHPNYNPNTSDNDIALLLVDRDLPVPIVEIAGALEMAGVRNGDVVTVVGWGDTGVASSSNRIREADVQVVGGVGNACANVTDYAVGDITTNQMCIGVPAGGVDTCFGDSGGPALIRRDGRWVQLGITSWGIGCAQANLPGVYTVVPNYYNWVHNTINRKLAYSPTNLDGDGDTDLTITTGGGSSWYSSSGNGAFTVPYTRADLAFGQARYTPGDFDADGDTDQVITTAGGSFWYFSNGNGTYTVPYTRNDLPLGAVNYVPGDFNGDDRTDLVVTTVNGSYWYFSNGNGTWNVPYTRNDLPLGKVEYTPGDFDADGMTDLVITTASGSFWYFSNGDGTWDVLHTRPTLTLGKVAFTPGDFDEDGRTDLVTVVTTGTNFLYSNGNGTWRDLGPRVDLKLGSVEYVPGDYNADGKTDLVISTPSGSYWYFAAGNGLWNVAYTRNDLPIGNVRFTPGDFNADARTDLVISTRSGSYWYFSVGNGTWTVPYTRNDLPI